MAEYDKNYVKKSSKTEVRWNKNSRNNGKMEVNPLNHKIADVYIFFAFIQLGIEKPS